MSKFVVQIILITSIVVVCTFAVLNVNNSSNQYKAHDSKVQG